MNISSVNQPCPGETTGKAAAARTVARSKDAAPAAQASAAADTTAASSEERLTLDQTESLTRAMNSCPDTRADVIARGKALAADPNYPPAAVVSKLSRLFVADAARDKDGEA